MSNVPPDGGSETPDDGPSPLASFAKLTSRFSVLAKHLAAGNRCLSEFIQFVNARIQAEKAYAEALQKVGQSTFGNQEVGTIFEGLCLDAVD